MKTIFYLFLLLFLSCSSFSSTSNTHIDSSHLFTKEKRIKELSKYFILRTAILNTHFFINDVNLNSRTVPGATYRDYRIAIKIDKQHIPVWISDVNPTNDVLPCEWTRDSLFCNDPDFNLSYNPEIYQAESKVVLLYRNEGVLFIRIQQN